MALKKKKNPFALLRAEVKRRKLEQEKKRNKPKPQGNRSITRAATTTGAVPKTSLKQRALNVKGKAKAVVRKAKGKAQAAVAKVDTKAERSAIAKGLGKRVSTAAKNAKSKAKDIYRKVDTKSERKALLGKAKSAVSKKAKSVGSAAKKQATFRLNKLTGTGTKGRAAALKNLKSKAKDIRGKARIAKSNTAAKLRGVKVKAQLKGLKVKGNIMKGLREAGIGAGRGKLRSKNKMTPATTNFGKGARATGKAIRSAKRNVRAAGSAAVDKAKSLSSAARNWSQKKKDAMKKLWESNRK
jgi:hypothetical protein